MRSFLFLFLSFCTVSLQAQKANYVQINAEIGHKTIESIKLVFPKFYREYQLVLKTDSLLKKVSFIDEIGVGPAFASPKGEITFNLNFLKKPKPAFDDNRLIVVLYHEIGHLHYYLNTVKTKWNPENSEKAAFEYSLFKTKEMAEKGDCFPLRTGLKFMKLRSESNELKDPHVRALKRMVNEALYEDYLKYLAEHCGVGR